MPMKAKALYISMWKYNKDHRYGILSGRNIEDLQNTTRAPRRSGRET